MEKLYIITYNNFWEVNIEYIEQLFFKSHTKAIIYLKNQGFTRFNQAGKYENEDLQLEANIIELYEQPKNLLEQINDNAEEKDYINHLKAYITSEIKKGLDNDKSSVNIIVNFEDKFEAESIVENQDYFIRTIIPIINNKFMVIIGLK